MAYKYTGKERDSTTGLYFYEARYYDPVLGRFISPDTFVQGPIDPQTLNRYAYVRNNPILYNDPSGNFFGIGALIGAIVGAVSAGIQSGGDIGAILTGAVIGGIAGEVGAQVGGFVAETVGSQFGNIAGYAAGGLAGGAAAGATGSVLYRLAGYNVDIGQGIAAGAAGGLVGGVVGYYCPICGVPAGAVVGASVSGGDPGEAALLSLIGVGVAVGYQAYEVYDKTLDYYKKHPELLIANFDSQTFKDRFLENLDLTNSVFFGFPQNFTRTGLGLALGAGNTVSKTFGTVTPFEALRSLFKPGIAGLQRGAPPFGVRATIISAGLNIAKTSAFLAISLELGIVTGSAIEAGVYSATNQYNFSTNSRLDFFRKLPSGR